MASKETRTRSRNPNKTIWNLHEIKDECVTARRQWEKAFEMAEKRMDVNLLLHLSRLRHAIDAIERRASDALNGAYQE